HTPQLIRSHQAQDQGIVGSGYYHRLNAVHQIRAMLYEPLTAALKIRVAIECVSGHRRGPKHRNEAHHGASTDRERIMSLRDKVVVEKSILLIPKRVLWVFPIVHGIGDVNVVLPELTREILVNGVPFRQQKSG